MNPALLLLVLALGAVSSVLAQEYTIQMRRPAKEGQRFELSCRLQETRRISAALAGRTTPEHKTNFVAELDALVEVLETDSKGRITKAACTVSNCLRVQDQNKRELLPTKTVVMASVEAGNLQFQVNGKAVDAETKRVLTEGMQLIDETSTEEILGTDQPRKVGESWEVNPNYFVSVLKSQNLGITKQDIQGRTTLEQVVKVGGVECLELASKVYLKNFLPTLPAEAQVQVKQAFGALRLTGKLPLDTSMAALEEGVDFDGTFVAQANAGPHAGVTTKTIWTIKRTVQRKYLK